MELLLNDTSTFNSHKIGTSHNYTTQAENMTSFRNSNLSIPHTYSNLAANGSASSILHSTNLTANGSVSSTPFPVTSSLGVASTTSQMTSSDNAIVAKISILLVLTAVMLIFSYKFVVRLFLGYADRKDDVLPDTLSDDEDSAVIKGTCAYETEFG